MELPASGLHGDDGTDCYPVTQHLGYKLRGDGLSLQQDASNRYISIYKTVLYDFI